MINLIATIMALLINAEREKQSQLNNQISITKTIRTR